MFRSRARRPFNPDPDLEWTELIPSSSARE
jgi:hypothetical protein